MENLTACTLAFALLLGSASRAAAAPLLDELLVQYRALGLPLPPKGAAPALLDSSWRTVDPKTKAEVRLVHLALRPGGARDPQARVLLGTAWHTPSPDGAPRVIPADPSRVPWPRLRGCHTPRFFEHNAALAAAIQCQALGMTRLAARLLEASRAQACGHRFSAFFQPRAPGPRAALAALAWAHWGDELTRPGSDRAALARRMRALLGREKSLDTKANRALLRSLELTLAVKRQVGDPSEALVDALVETANPASDADRDRRPPQEARVLAAGFAAVPALIRHLDDERLTRFVQVGFNNFPPWILRVQHVAGRLLQELAGEDLGKDWLRSQQGWPVERQAAAAWWKRARAAGEEAWLRQHVLPADPKQRWPNRAMLDLLAARYPGRLPEVYRALLDKRPQLQSWPVVKAIAGSGLDARTKTRLLLAGAKHKDLEHRRAALWTLKDLDAPQFKRIMLEILKATPKTPRTPYWSCREAAFAHLVIETADDEIWRALLAVARRVDVGLRMELMSPMTYTGKPNRDRRVRFLAEFLDDAAVRDSARDPRLFSGPFAAFTFPRIAVRDFAALQLASLLQLPGPSPDRTWSAPRWAALRRAVRARLASRGAATTP